jgi:hypothetical protein
MNRTFARAALTALMIAALALAGCGTAAEAEHPTDGVWGYVTSADSAQLEIATTQPGGDEIVVDRVLAPDAAWLVVHLNDDGKPGMRVGLAHVDAGETRDVRVVLDEVTGDSVIVAVHADKAEEDSFDFDMDAPTTSPDRPYFVEGVELAAVVTIR